MFMQFLFFYQMFFMNIKDFVQLFYETENYSHVNLMYLNTDIRLMKNMIIFKISEINIMLIMFYTAQKCCYN